MVQFPLLPLLAPLCLPFVSPSTYLAPSRCDRNRPPPSQVACKLTTFAPLHPVDPPLPNSQNPASPAPDNDDLGNILALGDQNRGVLYRRELNLAILSSPVTNNNEQLFFWAYCYRVKK